MKITGPIRQATLLRRYKRFLADVRFDDGSELTVHCANSGSMKGLVEPGNRVLVSDSQNDKRKLRHSLERVRVGRVWVGVNTMLPNHVAREGIERGRVPSLAGYETVRSEVVLHKGTRIDLRLEDESRRPCWVEVKNVTLRLGDAAAFPDAVTERGRKHVDELADVAASGDARAVLLFVVNRRDCDRVRPADGIDPAYGEALRAAAERGLEVLAHTVRFRGPHVTLAESLPVDLRPPDLQGTPLTS